jgi:WD40 repeat protein
MPPTSDDRVAGRPRRQGPGCSAFARRAARDDREFGGRHGANLGCDHRSGHHLEGDAGWIGLAAHSPDLQRVVTVVWGEAAPVWNASTGQVIAKPEGDSSLVTTVSFSPDGQRIVTASSGGTSLIFRIVTLDDINRRLADSTGGSW